MKTISTENRSSAAGNGEGSETFKLNWEIFLEVSPEGNRTLDNKTLSSSLKKTCLLDFHSHNEGQITGSTQKDLTEVSLRSGRKQLFVLDNYRSWEGYVANFLKRFHYVFSLKWKFFLRCDECHIQIH